MSFAALDAWEIRGLGRVDRDSDANLELSLRRLVVRTKPSAIVCAKPRSFHGVRAALKVVATVARVSGLPLVSLAGDILRELVDEMPDESEVRCQYPELRGIDPVKASDSAEALKVALATFAKIPTLPKRRYAPTIATNPASFMDLRRLPRHRTSSLRDGQTARRRARRRRSGSRRRAQDARR